MSASPGPAAAYPSHPPWRDSVAEADGKQTLAYLRGRPGARQSAAGIRAVLAALAAAFPALEAAERWALVNAQPVSLVQLDPLLDDVTGRFTDDEQERMLELLHGLQGGGVF